MGQLSGNEHVMCSPSTTFGGYKTHSSTKGDHQDEFLRGDRPKDLIRNSIVTSSLGAAVLNGKYVNALPLNRISQEFDRNGLTISRQTLANWVISFSKYLTPVWQRMKYHLLQLPVIQSDETPAVQQEARATCGSIGPVSSAMKPL